MSQFAQNVMLGSTCFFVGVFVGIVAASWAFLTADKIQDNTTAKSRIIQHGSNAARAHEKLATLSPQTHNEFAELAAEYKPALDLLQKHSEPDPAEFEKWQRNLRRAGKSRG